MIEQILESGSASDQRVGCCKTGAASRTTTLLLQCLVAAARAEPRKGDGWAECALPATSALVSRALRPSSVQLQCDEDAKGACLLGAGRSAWELYLVTPEPSDLSVGGWAMATFTAAGGAAAAE